jgi:hypothetical protein
MDALPNHDCPLCGGPNACAPARSGSLASPCWCREAEIMPAALARVPDALRRQACLCAACAADRTHPRVERGAPVDGANGA